MSESNGVDVVIVGAGAAGLAATRTARDLGLRSITVEASARIGGRAWTDPKPFGVPWDRGCHWLHSADINPFTALANRYGYRYRSEPPPRQLYHQEGRLNAEGEAAAEAFLDQAGDRIRAASQAGRDVPVATIVDQASPWSLPFRAMIAAEWGVSPEETSTLDYGRYRDTDRNWPVEDGYGALVARHAEGLPVTRSTPVERIDWGNHRVRVTTSSGAVEARAVIVTVSTAVLADGLIAFDPPLPVWKQEALAAVPLGRANKVALQIDGRRLGVDGHTNILVPVGSDAMMSFQLRPFGWDMANGYLAGSLCAELEDQGEAAMVDIASEALRSSLGSDAVRQIGATACSRWGDEPYVRGAYAAARPGQADRRQDLATPLADRLFFAGEATSPDFFSTCHGAHQSGIAAARAVAAAIVVASPRD